jgi:hypothetical protein
MPGGGGRGVSMHAYMIWKNAEKNVASRLSIVDGKKTKINKQARGICMQWGKGMKELRARETIGISVKPAGCELNWIGRAPGRG